MRKITVENWEEVPEDFTGKVKLVTVCGKISRFWLKNGKPHRDHGPCTVCKECLKVNKGILKYSNCTKIGPAKIFWTGMREWFLNGELHNVHGPAIKCNEHEFFWLYNKPVVKKAFELHYMLKYNKLYSDEKEEEFRQISEKTKEKENGTK